MVAACLPGRERRPAAVRREAAATQRRSTRPCVSSRRAGRPPHRLQCQALALIPGISRSGATMVGGLLLGLHHEAAAHFSFLIATPVIFGATGAGGAASCCMAVVPRRSCNGRLIAGVVAGVTAFASTAFLMRYFRAPRFPGARSLRLLLRGVRPVVLGDTAGARLSAPHHVSDDVVRHQHAGMCRIAGLDLNGRMLDAETLL